MAPTEPADVDVAGTPRWVKAFGLVALLLVLGFLLLKLAGADHGPARHGPAAADTLVRQS